MPQQKTKERAQRAARRGKAPTTQAGEFVREEIEHVRQGKHGARSPKQAIAIGLSKARRAGVKLPPPPKGRTSEKTRRSARARIRTRPKRCRNSPQHETVPSSQRQRSNGKDAKQPRDQRCPGRPATADERPHNLPVVYAALSQGGQAGNGQQGGRGDSKTSVGGVPPTIAKEKSKHGQAEKPRHIQDARSGRETRASCPVLQTALSRPGAVTKRP